MRDPERSFVGTLLPVWLVTAGWEFAGARAGYARVRHAARGAVAFAVAGIAALCTLVLVACGPSPDHEDTTDARAAAQVRDRLASYATAAAAVDAERSTAHFSATGTLFEPGIPPIVGARAIRDFIASFPGVRVDSSMLRADTVEVYGSTAMVWGTYFERLDFPGQPRSAQHGRFVMQWRRSTDSVWQIERYYRVPLPQGWVDR